MIEWLDLFRRAAGDLRGPPPLIGTLATVDLWGSPRARSVVCREVGYDGSAWFTSDARSEKNDHLSRMPRAEFVCWLPVSREQFRLFGHVELISTGQGNPAERLRHWRQLTDASRAMFHWPAPGGPRVDDPAAFPAAIGAETDPPATFEVIVLRPTVVEHLRLSEHPHRRTRWRKEDGWRAAELNP